MPDETHRLQPDPPEGSREVIDHELARQSAKEGGNAAGGPEKPGSQTGSANPRSR